MTTIYESVTAIDVGLYLIRVWRNEPELKDEYDNGDLRDLAMSLWHKASVEHVPISRKHLAETLAAIARVSAVEVKHKGDDSAVVVYNNWPSWLKTVTLPDGVRASFYDITNTELLLASVEKNKPSQSWYDEDHTGLWSQEKP